MKIKISFLSLCISFLCFGDIRDAQDNKKHTLQEYIQNRLRSFEQEIETRSKTMDPQITAQLILIREWSNIRALVLSGAKEKLQAAGLLRQAVEVFVQKYGLFDQFNELIRIDQCKNMRSC